MKSLDNEIKYLKEKYKDENEKDYYDYLEHILGEEYTNKYQNLRLVLNNTKIEKLYKDFMSYIGLNDLIIDDSIKTKDKTSQLKNSGIYDIDGEKKPVIILESNIKDLYSLIKYNTILTCLKNGDDENISYIKAMLLEKYLTDYLLSIGVSKTECEKIKMYNLMEIVYISIIINCGIKEAQVYNECKPIDQNILDETRKKIKSCVDYDEEIKKYNFMNTKKYIYGIIYSTYLHQKFTTKKELLEFINRSMNMDEFKALYNIENNSSKIYEYYNKEYRS